MAYILALAGTAEPIAVQTDGNALGAITWSSQRTASH
jgi:hypothetical protein